MLGELAFHPAKDVALDAFDPPEVLPPFAWPPPPPEALLTARPFAFLDPPPPPPGAANESNKELCPSSACPPTTWLVAPPFPTCTWIVEFAVTE